MGKSCHLLYEEEELKKVEGKILLELRDNRYYRGITQGKKKDGSCFFQEISLTAIESGDIVCVVRDITDRMQAEKERQSLEENLRMMDKMKAIGTLASGIAHNFNNILTIIMGNASMALMSMDPSDPNFDRLKQIEYQVKRGSNLAGQLLGFARVGKYDIKTTNMNDFLEKISFMLVQARKEFSISFDMNKNLYPVDIDAGQMEQVLTNLFFNACDAMPGGGSIVLSADNLIIEDDSKLSLKAGRYVKVSMSDQGVGMDDETKKRIFEPFFTTKEVGRGSGLGLATVYGIIKGHEGIIDVSSEPSKGTTFSIYLPASNSDVVADKIENRNIDIGSGTILLIDDEQSALSVNAEILQQLGYRICQASSGQQAVDIFKEREDIDLVILDMIMPGMSGRKTFEFLKEINPDIRIILLTGYSRNEEAEFIMKQGCCGFFQKPFDTSQLSRAIKRILRE
jgi:signal transduction histidine kinase